MKKLNQLNRVLAFAVCLMCFVCADGKTVFASELQDWIGQHSRLVWVQDQGNGSDTFGQGKNLALYGYDSVDGKGERQLVKGVGNFFKPLFTPDGTQVIYSDRRAREMYLLDWESGKVEKLGSGVAVALWEGAETGFFLKSKPLWVYYFSGRQPENKYGTAQPLYRFPLGSPKKKELVWDKTNMAWSNVQLSRDGEILGGLFPWPHGGILQTDSKAFTRFGRGCWTSLSPDNSKLLWIFDGLHRNVQIHDIKSSESWKVNINSAPGIGGFEVYHPRWSNHPRYFVMTGPYEKGDGGNRIGGGGDKVEVYVGRLDENARAVEDWLKITRNSRADFYPDLWVEGGGAVSLKDALPKVSEVTPLLKWPEEDKSLVYVWEDMMAANQLPANSSIGFYQCNLNLRGRALFTRDLGFNATGGWGETGDAGEKIGQVLMASKQAGVEILITPEKAQDATFFSLQSKEKKGLSFVQKDGTLIIENSPANGEIQRLEWPAIFIAGKAVHLVLGLKAGQVELFKNGKSLGTKAFTFDFVNNPIGVMTLGDVAGDWAGVLSQVAVYDQPLAAEQVLKHSQYSFDKESSKQPLETLVLDAELLETTDIPSPDAIGAYSRALVVNSYAVKKVIAGTYSEEKVVLAEWAVLDRQIVKSYQDSGGIERLVLEKFDDHPELEGERQMMDIFEPDLTMYYRVK